MNNNKEKQEWAESMENRFIDLAARIIKLSDNLPKAVGSSHIGKQLLRSGTAPAPNFGEARGAESRADFAHKLKIVLKELNETKIWIKILIRSKLLKDAQCRPLIDEIKELSRIVNASISTARKNAK